MININWLCVLVFSWLVVLFSIYLFWRTKRFMVAEIKRLETEKEELKQLVKGVH